MTDIDINLFLNVMFQMRPLKQRKNKNNISFLLTKLINNIDL